MEQRRLGSLDVSLAGLGCNNFGWRIDEATSREVVHAALDSGVTLFDTAEMYGRGRSEEYLGTALGDRRRDVVIATKFAWDPPAANVDPVAWVVQCCEGSLRRLGTDHIDLYYFHRPHPELRIADMLEGMNRLTAEGKVSEIGCCRLSEEQLQEAAGIALERGLRPFVVVENEYSLLQREPERGVLEACDRLGMKFVPYFPLAAGLLTGKYRRGRPAPAGSRLAGDNGGNAEAVVDAVKLDAVERLAEYAEARGHSLLELALSWLAARPRVASVIAGATSPEQARANAAAVEAWPLSLAELGEIDALAERS